MIFEKVNYQKAYPIEGYGTYLQEKATVEGYLEPGETLKDALFQAEKELDEWHDSKSEYKRPDVGVSLPSDYVNFGDKAIKIWNLQAEQTEIAIENAECLDDLLSIEEKCTTGPLLSQYVTKFIWISPSSESLSKIKHLCTTPELVKQYMSKVKQLTNNK